MVRKQTRATKQSSTWASVLALSRAIEHPARDRTDVGDHSNSKNLDVPPASGPSPLRPADPRWKMGVESAAEPVGS